MYTWKVFSEVSFKRQSRLRKLKNNKQYLLFHPYLTLIILRIIKQVLIKKQKMWVSCRHDLKFSALISVEKLCGNVNYQISILAIIRILSTLSFKWDFRENFSSIHKTFECITTRLMLAVYSKMAANHFLTSKEKSEFLWKIFFEVSFSRKFLPSNICNLDSFSKLCWTPQPL